MRQHHHAIVISAVLLGLAGCATAPQPVQSPDAAQPPADLPQQAERNQLGKRIAEQARAQLGAPYRYGGADPAGFDCSGLVRFVYAQLQISAPRTAAEQQQAAAPVSLDGLQPGDLVFYRAAAASTDHVGIFIGDGQFVHAPRAGRFVEIRRLDDPWYAQRFSGAGRLAAPR